jgi:hypothetical protein
MEEKTINRKLKLLLTLEGINEVILNTEIFPWNFYNIQIVSLAILSTR